MERTAPLPGPAAPTHWVVRRLYTSNPFYVISADLVFVGLRMSFDTSGRTFETGALMGSLLGYTLLLATTGCLLIRLGNVWDDVRTILLLVVAMFLAISVTFDAALAESPGLGVALNLGGLAFAVAVSEGLLRGIRLRLPALFRTPYYLILALFFLYPVALTPLLSRPDAPALQWLLFGFSAAAGVAFLSLLPAVRRGAGYVAKNGSPWPFPLYPWTLFGLLAVAACGRAYYLCVSLHFVTMSSTVGRSDTIFGPYFLVPFLFALDLLLLEAGIVSRSRGTQRLALLAVPALVGLSTVGLRFDPVFRGFLGEFVRGTGATPLYASLVAAAGFFGYAAWRGVSGGLGGLTCCLLALTTVGPGTLDLDGTVPPRPWPLLAAGVVQGALALRRGESWRGVVGLACLALAALVVPGEGWAGRHPGLVAYHVAAGGAVLLGAAFDDAVGRACRRAAAALLALASAGASWDGMGFVHGVPRDLAHAYAGLVVLACAGLWTLTRSRPYLLAAATGLAGWGSGVGWLGYCGLRRAIIGLDWIVSGLAFFAVAAAISLVKTGALARWSARKPWGDQLHSLQGTDAPST